MTEQAEKLRNLGQRIRSKLQEPQRAKSQLQAMKQRGAAELPRFSRFFGRQAKILKRVLAIPDLPDWGPRAFTALDNGGYKTMDLSARRRLEDYFEAHNQKLYEYLDMDFGW